MHVLVPYGLLIVYTMIFVFVCVETVSVGVSLIANNTVVGALGLHIHLAATMMNNSVLSYYDPFRMEAYFFIIDGDGYVFMHPKFPKMVNLYALPTMIHLRSLEREAHRHGIIESMMR